MDWNPYRPEIDLPCSFEPPELVAWPTRGRVSIDTETYDPSLGDLGPGVRRGGYVVGVSVAIEGGPSMYLPVRHQGGGNMPEERVKLYLADCLKHFRGEVAGANLPYDLDYLAEMGLEFSREVKFRDVQVAAPLLDENHRSYSLAAIAKRAGVRGKDEAALHEAAKRWGVNAKGGLWKMHAGHAAAYARADAEIPLLILRQQEKEIDEWETSRGVGFVEGGSLRKIYDLECDLLPVLVRMRRRGVRVNLDKLAQVEDKARAEEMECLRRIKHATGISVGLDEIWQQKLVVAVLRHLGVEVPTTAKGNLSVTKEFLHDLARESQNQTVVDLLKTRKWNKLRTTFAKSIRDHVTSKGRIHTTFNQLRKSNDDGTEEGARYGRVSCVDPNLQQQPSPDRDPEVSGEWRQVYVPDDGAEWASCDYSAQEPRALVWWAARMNCRGAAEVAREYARDPRMDLHQRTADIAGIKRKQAKTIMLGRSYGMGGAKLCRNLGLPTVKNPEKTAWLKQAKKDMRLRRQESNNAIEDGPELEYAGPEGEAIIKKFDTMVPFIRELADKCTRHANGYWKPGSKPGQRTVRDWEKGKGWIRTKMGRVCRFDPHPDEIGFFNGHQGVNRVVQGSCGDQMKKAMVDADRAGFEIQLQVHDELDQSVSGRKQAEELARIMVEADRLELKNLGLTIPTVVDVEVGPSWGEVK